MSGSRERPRVSIVIPCFNMGEYLDEAVNSALGQSYPDCEVIIVDDGSTDVNTLRVLERVAENAVAVVRQSNQGLASSRNAGIAICSGKYVLPLDADDKIGPTYVEQAVQVLESQVNVGIVYCRAELFGEENGPWKLPPFRMPSFLLTNSIFCSAVFRRADWQGVSGYNSNMKYGLEDHDFWLSLVELGREVHCLPETLFFYRMRPESMYRRLTHDQLIFSYAQLVRNHPRLYMENLDGLTKEMIRRGLKRDRLEKGVQVLAQLARVTIRRVGQALNRPGG